MILFYLKKIFSLACSLVLISMFLWKSSFAASDASAFSLNNTDFVVLIAFIAFVGLLLYLKVPIKIADLLDNRSKAIRDEINNANLILEESKTTLAELEREHKINIKKAKQILVDAETEAKDILTEAKKEIRLSIERKVKLAQDQIKATEESVIKSMKDQAIDKAVELAEKELLNKKVLKTDDSSIERSLNDFKTGFKKL